MKIPEMPTECYEDMIMFGTAVYRVNDDGKTERVNPLDIKLKNIGKKNGQKLL